MFSLVKEHRKALKQPSLRSQSIYCYDLKAESITSYFWLELSTVFDRVHHNILIDPLESRVDIKHTEFHSTFYINCGMLQGSNSGIISLSVHAVLCRKTLLLLQEC